MEEADIKDSTIEGLKRDIDEKTEEIKAKDKKLQKKINKIEYLQEQLDSQVLQLNKELEKEKKAKNKLEARIDKMEEEHKVELTKVVSQNTEPCNAQKGLEWYFEKIRQRFAIIDDKFKLELNCNDHNDIGLITSLKNERLPTICEIKLVNISNQNSNIAGFLKNST